jgi:PAS domain S-box-containing protein
MGAVTKSASTAAPESLAPALKAQVPTPRAISEEHFRAFVNASSDVVYRMSPDWKQMHQLDGHGFLSDTVQADDNWLDHYIHPDDRPVVQAAVAKAIRTRSLFELEHRVRCADGNFGWTLSRAVPILDASGDITEWLGAARDITARRETEVALRASEERLQRVLETEAIGVLFFNHDGTLIGANDVFLKMTGWSRAEVESGSLDWRRMTPPEWVAASEAEMGTLQHTGRLGPYEKEYLRKDGSRSWMLFAGRDLGDGTIVEFAADISALKKAEAALRESETQFRGMADSLPQLAWMADEKGWIYWYNKRWYEYTGTRLEEMEGWGWRSVHHPDHVDRAVAGIQRSWDSGEPWEDTFPLRGADGEYRWFLSRAEPIRNSEGRVTRWFGTNTDITERYQREELQKLLIHEVSHRVKNSLSIVSALLQLQARTLEDAPRRALEDASSRVRVVATVHDRLWRQSDASEVDLASFLSSLAAAIGTSGAQHATVVEVEPALVSADLAVRLGLLINELVTNAYKYAYAPGEDGEVRVAGQHTTDGRYRVDVSDLGRGLPTGFDLSQPRSSFGMRVITSVASQLNGNLALSPTDRGTRFTLEFPLTESSRTA